VTKLIRGKLQIPSYPSLHSIYACLHTELISLSTVIGLIEEFEFFARNELNPKKELDANLVS